MGAVLSSQLARQLAALRAATPGLAGVQLDALIAHPDAVVHPGLRQSLPAPVLAVFSQALAQALHAVFLVAFGIACLALLSAFLVPAGRAQDLALDRSRLTDP